jgi:pimeloyl-ACP methyl ester carboxylesterase
MRSDRTARSDSLKLSDGRRMVFRVTGPADGLPVLYCHGAIGTPLGASVDLEAMADRLAVRYIAPSRPGVGGSDPLPGRTVLDFAADVRELADALELERFSVVGVSAGGPYALAIAHQLRARVRRVAVCSSLSPLFAPHRTPGMLRRIRLALSLVARAPGLCCAVGDAVLPVIARHPELLSHVIAAHAAPSERERLARPAERSAASTSFLDAAAGGVAGMVEDFLIYSREWGFPLEEIYGEVHLWHGLDDALVPVEHALALAATLRRCRLFLDQAEGHHFFRSNLARILGVLIGREADAGAGVETTIAAARALVGRRGSLRPLPAAPRAAGAAPALTASPPARPRSGRATWRAAVRAGGRRAAGVR